MSSTWTEDRTKRCVQLWKDGLSASEIANRLGGVTRNGVIGKIHRLGLSGRQFKKKTPRRSRSRPSVFRRSPELLTPREAQREHFRKLAEEARATRVEYVEHHVPEDKRVGVLGLNDSQCRWPIGDPRQPDFHFCDQAKVLGMPYCQAHALRAYASPTISRAQKAKRASNDNTVSAKEGALT